MIDYEILKGLNKELQKLSDSQKLTFLLRVELLFSNGTYATQGILGDELDNWDLFSPRSKYSTLIGYVLSAQKSLLLSKSPELTKIKTAIFKDNPFLEKELTMQFPIYSLGYKLRQSRINRNIPLSVIAKQTAISVWTLKRMESDGRTITLKNFNLYVKLGLKSDFKLDLINN